MSSSPAVLIIETPFAGYASARRRLGNCRYLENGGIAAHVTIICPIKEWKDREIIFSSDNIVPRLLSGGGSPP